MFIRIVLAVTLSLFALSANAQTGAQVSVDIRQLEMTEDYQSTIYFLTMPPEARAEAGRRIAIVGAGGILTLIGVNYLASNLYSGVAKRVFTGVLRTSVFMGALLFIDGYFAYMTDGRIVPISMAIDELLTFSKPAKAATWGDYYTEDETKFKEFMSLGAERAVPVMEMNPELAMIVRAFAQVCREQVGQEVCR